MKGVTIDAKAFQEQMMKSQGYNLFRFRKRSMSYRTMQDVRNLYGTTSQPLARKNNAKGFAN